MTESASPTSLPDTANDPLMPESHMKVREVELPLIPYHRPCNPKLGDAIRGLVKKRTAVLRGHQARAVKPGLPS